ncbi:MULTISPECIES: 23S rRNA (adenine(2503)-C(2))-methyltransferase RlmN [Prochlorococcus]|uniref:23S rRNA (adenine(2503)-C(2))-methyltransferase RlmN n=1 Tax=Prochlorococcus TaxID=1218 RepID=UPI000533B4FB|nr:MULTISPECIES: 23S rRNA (adenine(2503)-C(2))-methyltransferase RlmN [Prochlorococcus]KGG13510.1 Ribosomal RNA large subunit methyltransferase N [Prochlorococcus sp. MIT 0601]
MIASVSKAEKIVLLGRNISQLEKLAKDHGESTYRGRQLHEFVYGKGVKSIEDIFVLPKSWRNSLNNQGFQIGRLREIKRLEANDQTIKLLLGTTDGEIIETVGIPTKNRLTICVSSQVGCPMGCKFCATGKGGLQRSLEVNEIVDQVLSTREAFQRRASHVVFMGMGEPLLNIESVLDSISCMNTDLGIGQRRITLSTVGVQGTLSQLAELALERLGRVQFTLAVSLHAPNQKLREMLIPSAKSYPIRDLLDDCKHYFSVTGRRVSFEYILLGEINDQIQHAEELSDLIGGFQSHVNLIAYNPIDEEDFQRPSLARIRKFMEALRNRGIAVSLRSSRGLDKNAACGQLRRQHASLI